MPDPDRDKPAAQSPSDDAARPLKPTFDDSKAVWTQFGMQEGWHPEEHPGWWLVFDSARSANVQGYGPFPTREDAEGYLRWAMTEATITRSGGPAIVVAIRAADNTKVIDVQPQQDVPPEVN